MTDLALLLAIAAVAAVVGIGTGILLARPIDRAMQRADETGTDEPTSDGSMPVIEQPEQPEEPEEPA